jgi:hypothetical protein
VVHYSKMKNHIIHGYLAFVVCVLFQKHPVHSVFFSGCTLFFRQFVLIKPSGRYMNLLWSISLPYKINSEKNEFVTISDWSLTFRGPCIVIYSYNENQRDALISQIYFWNRNLHVSDRFSVHYRDSSTVYTATGICHTDFDDCLLAGPVSKQSANLVWHIPTAVYTVLDTWWWTKKPVRNM